MADEMVPGESEDSEGLKPRVKGKGKGSNKKFAGIWEGTETDSENPELEEKIKWKMTVEVGTDSSAGTIQGGSDFDFSASSSDNKVVVYSLQVTNNESHISLPEPESFNFTSLDTFDSDPDNLNNGHKMDINMRFAQEDASSFHAGHEEKFSLTGTFHKSERTVEIEKVFCSTGRKVTYTGQLWHNTLLNEKQPLNSYEAEDLPSIVSSYEEFKDTKSVYGTFLLKLKTPVDM